MAATTDYSLFHFHPVGLYALKDLMNIQRPSIIEVHREVTGPSIEELFPWLKLVQERKALLISWCPDAPGKVPLEAEIRYALRNLSPRGLCLHFAAKDAEEGKSIIRLVNKVLREDMKRNTN